MPRQKLKHIRAVGGLKNVHNDPSLNKGKWAKTFGNENPIILEIGCGYGQYALGLGKMYPAKNFVGLDKKGDRVYGGAKRGLERELKNVTFIRGLAENLDDFFDEDEIDEIWVTFPDPFPKPCKANRRLISPRFLELYRRVLKPGGKVYLKTDNYKLFEYSIEVVEAEKCLINEVIRDLHAQKEVAERLKITTFYEEKFIKEGLPIYYLEFTFLV